MFYALTSKIMYLGQFLSCMVRCTRKMVLGHSMVWLVARIGSEVDQQRSELALHGESLHGLLQELMLSISSGIPFQNVSPLQSPSIVPKSTLFAPPPSKTLAKNLIFWHSQPHLPHSWAYLPPPSKTLTKSPTF